jgi:DNA-binding PadR family transcriptional regulator
VKNILKRYVEVKMLEYIILGSLCSGEMSGYDIKQRISNCISYFFDASFGSIYPTLKRLEAKGFIKSSEIVEEGRYKKLYALNDTGKAEFQKWLEAPIMFTKTRHDHLVKLYYYDALQRDKALENLKDLIRQVEALRDDLAKHKSYSQGEDDPRVFIFFTIDYGIGYLQFIIDTCNMLIRKLEGNLS